MRKAQSYNEIVATLDLTGISEKSRAAILRGVRGGDGSTEPPTVAELLDSTKDVTALDDAELATLVNTLKERGRELAAEGTDEALDQVDKIVEAVEKLGTTQGERAAAASARAERAAKALETLAADAEGEEDADADKGDDDKDEDDKDGEDDDADKDADADKDGDKDADADAAAAKEKADADAAADKAKADADAADDDAAEETRIAASRITRVEARRPNSMRPRARATKSHKALKLVASASIPGVPAGTHLDTPEKIAAAFGEAIALCRGYRGGYEQVRVASLGVFDAAEVYGEERTLRRDAEANDRKIDAFAGQRAIKASGGICAPAPIDYTQPVLGVTDRPVWNGMLARFGADRGGIRTLPVPTLSDVASGISAWTEANDVDPSDPTTKPCVTMTCPDDSTTLVDALTQCIKVGNFRQRYWPEQVEAWVKKAAIQAARFAESRHLTSIGDGSTQIAVDQVLGTTRDVLATLDHAGAIMRNNFRLDPDFPLHFGFPAWLLDNMITDLARELPGATAERLATSDAMLADWMKIRNINPTPFLDGESGQLFPIQGDGLLNHWPSEAITYLYPEGVWLGLDGGSLDFGVVRDSTLNATNDLQIFSETFENVHFHGDGASYRMAIDICANGTTSNGVDLDVCSSGS